MARNRQQLERRAVINLTQRELTLLLLEKAPDDAEARCRHRRIVWRQEAHSLKSDDGRRELTAALTRLAVEEKLSGLPLHVTLNGDLCVTRVVSGENDAVRQGVQELIERSRGYLSLGPGEKITATSAAAIDARRRHVWVSVASRAAIENIAAAFEAARLKLIRIEHSLATMSRVMQAIHEDAENPALLIEVTQGSVDVGISYKGQLLLDYRPSGQQARENVSLIVMRHTKRLQRYLDKLLKAGSRPIRTICVSGEKEVAELVREQFLELPESRNLSLKLIEPRDVSAEWDFADTTGSDCTLTSSLGCLLRLTAPGQEASPYPDLLEPVREHRRGPELRKLLRAAWPVAATVAASILLGGLAFLKQLDCRELEAQVAVLENDLGAVTNLQREVMTLEAEHQHLVHIRDSLRPPVWKETLVSVGTCLPQGVWLREMGADRTGSLLISGSSHSEDGVFEFLRHLRSVPRFNGVALESTQQAQSGQGPTVQFAVRVALEGVSPPLVSRREGHRH